MPMLSLSSETVEHGTLCTQDNPKRLLRMVMFSRSMMTRSETRHINVKSNRKASITPRMISENRPRSIHQFDEQKHPYRPETHQDPQNCGESRISRRREDELR